MSETPRLRILAGAAAFMATAGGVLAVLLWARRLDVPILAIAVMLIATGAVLVWRIRRERFALWIAAALAVLLVTLAVAVRAEREFRRVEVDWPDVVAMRNDQLGARLGDLMATQTRRGREAAALAAAAAESGDASRLFDRLADVTRQTRVDALAVLGPGGNLVAWAGDHRGTIPDAVRQGTREAYFAERPLYSYLYFVAPVKGPTLHHAVGAVLVETSAFARPGEPGFTTTFAARTNVPAVFRSGAGHGSDVAWSLVVAGDTVVHARLDPVRPVDHRSDLQRTARRTTVPLAFIALILASIGWLRRSGNAGPHAASMAPLAMLAVCMAIAPLGEVLGMEGRASSLAFLLPVPGVSLGDVTAVLVAAVALAATLRTPRLSGNGWRAALAISVVALAAIYALALRSVIAMATPSLLQGGSALWFGVQSIAVLFLTLATALILPSRRPADGVRIVPVIGALAVAALLCFAAQAVTYANREAMPALALAWSLPVLLLAIGTAGARGPRQRAARWLATGFVAASAVLPQLWGANTQARLQAAEIELASFGADTPTIVEYRLDAFAREVKQRYAAGETGAQLLYRSWVASGLAREPYPVRITLWPENRPPTELGLGGAEGSDIESPVIRDLVRMYAQTDTPKVGGVPGMSNVSRLLTARLDSQLVVSVTVQPRRSLRQIGITAPFLGSVSDPEARVSLVLATGSDLPLDSVSWSRGPGGWRSESRVWYPDGDYHAHMEVRFTQPLMRVTRGALLIAFDLALLILLWTFGHAARGLRVIREASVRSWMASFRARVTVALFVFFLVPTAVFGWIAYGGMSSVVLQAAGEIAMRAAQQAEIEWPQVNFSLRELSTRAGADVLYYLRGELADASSPEGKELGVYGAWIGADAYRILSGEDEPTTLEESRLEGRSYMTAYRRLRPSGVLAVPVALSVGDTATRQRDIAHLTMLAAVLGLLLSGVLSVAVGRALAGPIGELRRAAAAVGAGRMTVRLGERAGDEFGQLYTSFNRMARRLRRARAQEVRTARILAWGEMAQQIAHEIKNPLTPIKLAVQHLRRAHRDGHPAFGRILDDNVEQILTEINRLTEISRAFSKYGAPPEHAGPLADVNVGSVVREAITLYRAGDSKVEYDADIEADLPAASARTGELREVLMNLLENARDAVGDAGRVTIGARRANGRVEVTVRDDGPGIAAELVHRIFDPHFSTRSSGTGLGLAIVRRIVESWGGTVDVDSRNGEGTTFTVRIPQAFNDEDHR